MLPEPLDSGDFYAPRAFGLGGFFMLPEPLDSGDFLPARLGLENFLPVRLGLGNSRFLGKDSRGFNLREELLSFMLE